MTDTVVTLPADITGGYETTQFNALRHGVLSRYTIAHRKHCRLLTDLML